MKFKGVIIGAVVLLAGVIAGAVLLKPKMITLKESTEEME